MDEQKYIKNNQKAVFIFSATIIMVLIFLMVQNVFFQKWKNYQKEYHALSEKIADSLDLSDPVISESGIYEIDLTHFQRVDRCITCHSGIENPWMKDVSPAFHCSSGRIP